jgi:signal transduction histidine kinase
LGSWDWDSRTDKITWSEEYRRIVGYDPKKNPPGYDEHIKIYTYESARRLDTAVKKAMTKGIAYTLDLEQKRPHGKRGWITARSEVKRDKKNKIIGLRGTAQDITEHMLTEMELERLNRSLLILSKTNKTIIHAKDEDDLLKEIREIIVKTGAYHFMWIGFAENDIAKTVRPVLQVGVGEKYLKSAKITWADVESGRGPTGSAIRTGLTQIARDIENDERMKPWKKALNKLGCKSSIAIPLTNEGKSFGALNIYSNKVDAFSYKEIEILEELANDLAFGISTLRLQKKVEERTHEVDELKNKFIQIVSHQLRTPLNVIRWDLETLLNRERGEMDPAQIETLRIAYAANIEIISRLNDLLTAIDIEENRIRMDLNTIDTMDLFHSVCEEKLQSSHLKKIKGKIIKPKTPLPAIKADAVKIRDVIARLIDNAISYSNEGGSIIIKFSYKKNKIRFEISDTGIGIPSSETSYIFQRFHRGWNASQMKPDASGLSLFIAKNYIEAHHGEIGFSSTEKKKSTFWFELPVA